MIKDVTLKGKRGYWRQKASSEQREQEIEEERINHKQNTETCYFVTLYFCLTSKEGYGEVRTGLSVIGQKDEPTVVGEYGHTGEMHFTFMLSCAM